MIVKITNEKPPVSGYEKYFLFEAPGDETPAKKNVKVIKLRPYDKRRTDYTKMVPQIEDTPDESGEDSSNVDTDGEASNDTSPDTESDNASDTTSDANGTDVSNDANSDNTDESDNVSDDASGMDSNGDVTTDDTDYGTDDNDSSDDISSDATDDTPTDETDYSSDDNDSTDDGDDVTDDTDYNADDGGTDDTDDTGDTNNQDTDTESPDNKSNKFVLFKKFITLEGAITNYIQKLSGIISDDVECNRIYKKITNNLKELDDMTHEYMIIKFENSSYVESMLFYQRILASIGINFNMLKCIRDKELKTNNKKNKTLT